MPTIMHRQPADLDHLYTRYACRLQAAVTELLAEVGPTATDHDEDVTQDVWLHVAEHGLPGHLTGLDALLAIARTLTDRVRTDQTRRREIPAGLIRTATDTPAAARPAPAGRRRPRTTTARYLGSPRPQMAEC
ncbi:hypothetical protein [Kitasatospora griseola]|uniref:hypothetical protein n=1 Tax=Kitasatospora griseola TaxID=2064 RepID=UPI001670814A|nr:hypothetical protein [Kitasatospora griseola]GGR04250.1 hypothetical protein GCM10010195_69670 [Kitasatospora griseola]